MRLIREYARTDGLRRALLLVLEQATLPYATGSAPMPGGNTGAALLFGDGAGVSELDRVTVRPGADLASVPAVISARCRDARDTTLVVGASVADQVSELPGSDIRTALAERPHTGAWWELAGALADAETSRLVLADYDDESRSLCLADFSLNSPG
jgi:4-hydroxymandelate oxidase